MAIPLDAVESDKALLTKVSTLASESVTRALPDLSPLSSQEAGGVIRTVATGVLASVGEVATQTARQSYDSMSLAALDALILENGRRGIRSDLALLNARAAAMRAEAYVAKPVVVRRIVETTLDPIVGNSMMKFSQGAFVEAGTALASAISRAVSNVYRDTIVTNSQNDPRATGYQRVASSDACAFCLVVCLNQYTSFDEAGGYHDHCSCSTVPVFSGMSAVRPDYYNDFQSIYAQAGVEAQSSKAEDIFAAIRLATGRR